MFLIWIRLELDYMIHRRVVRVTHTHTHTDTHTHTLTDTHTHTHRLTGWWSGWRGRWRRSSRWWWRAAGRRRRWRAAWCTLAPMAWTSCSPTYRKSADPPGRRHLRARDTERCYFKILLLIVSVFIDPKQTLITSMPFCHSAMFSFYLSIFVIFIV